MATLAEILPSQDEMVASILATYSKATKAQKQDGETWYQTAHHLAVRLDPTNILRAAGVISALSPRMEWDRNMFLAERTYSEGKAYGCLGDSCRKANAIYGGSNVVKTLNAPKTTNFALTIVEPKHKTLVVVDRHAVSVALGRASTDADMTTLNRKGAYDWYADAYRAAARSARVLPSTMQAVTWVVWRETELRVSASVRAKAGRA
jgi:hypothetical protein